MPELAQFLFPPEAIFQAFDGPGSTGFLVLGASMVCVCWLVQRLDLPGVSWQRCFQSVGLSMAVVFGVLFLVQAIAIAYSPETASTSVFRSSGFRNSLSRSLLQATREVGHGRAAAGAVLILVVGWGYGSSIQNLSVLDHVVSYTAGVGLAEELLKLGLAALALSAIFRSPFDMSRPKPRMLVAGMSVAAVGFSVAEAFYYFGLYSRIGSPAVIYFGRATWCLALHVSWSLFVAGCVVRIFRSVGNLEGYRLVVWLTVAVLPGAALHGIYDALAIHGIGLMWLVGFGSIGLAWNEVRALAASESNAPNESGAHGPAPSVNRSLVQATEITLSKIGNWALALWGVFFLGYLLLLVEAGAVYALNWLSGGRVWPYLDGLLTSLATFLGIDKPGGGDHRKTVEVLVYPALAYVPPMLLLLGWLGVRKARRTYRTAPGRARRQQND